MVDCSHKLGFSRALQLQRERGACVMTMSLQGIGPPCLCNGVRTRVITRHLPLIYPNVLVSLRC